MKEFNNQIYKSNLLDNSDYHELGYYGRHIFFCDECFDNVSPEEYDFSKKSCISCCKKLQQKFE